MPYLVSAMLFALPFAVLGVVGLARSGRAEPRARPLVIIGAVLLLVNAVAGAAWALWVELGNLHGSGLTAEAVDAYGTLFRIRGLVDAALLLTAFLLLLIALLRTSRPPMTPPHGQWPSPAVDPRWPEGPSGAPSGGFPGPDAPPWGPR